MSNHLRTKQYETTSGTLTLVEYPNCFGFITASGRVSKIDHLRSKYRSAKCMLNLVQRYYGMKASDVAYKFVEDYI